MKSSLSSLQISYGFNKILVGKMTEPETRKKPAKLSVFSCLAKSYFARQQNNYRT